ncbi:LAME_0G07734g1_1 [Lachancea meyersii CBS 8951]|uniref:LAME_0G07734g1_1 n=1 Tax=Lachancea meyersii CBS 8951 TaxID=1266667 RepID=A0A1G4K847_9SACH|nr:LAME_0G07734g1_1 [Lachancea meyersii CBS 8951]
MILPMEILEQIVTSGLDSFETAKAWCKLSPSFQTQVTRNLGILVISDCANGYEQQPKQLFAGNSLLDYMSLSDGANTTIIDTAEFDKVSLRQFLQKYQNLLFVIVTDKHFSESLLALLTCIVDQIAGINANHRKNICMVYKTVHNFLSKIYFRQLLLSPRLIRLCELHLLSGSDLAENDNIDLDLVFETTNLYNVKRVFSLNIQNASHVLRAPSLVSIRELELNADVNPSRSLAHAPLLSTIQRFRLPTGLGSQTRYQLPACDHLGLVNYNPKIAYPLLEGKDVRESLTIATSLKSEGGVLKNMNFPQVKNLCITSLVSSVDEVDFQDCNFEKLQSYDESNSFGPTKWGSLIASNAKIDSVKASVDCCSDLSALMRCPFTLKGTLEVTSKLKGEKILSVKDELSKLTADCRMKNLLIHCSYISITLGSIWQYALFFFVICPYIAETATLCVKINFELLQNDIQHQCHINNIARDELFGMMNLPSKNGILQLVLPQAKRIILLDVTSVKSAQFSAVEERSNVNDVWFKSTIRTGVSNLQDPISPSEFRRNSLAGSDSDTARRNSIVTFNSPAYLHIPSESGKCPNLDDGSSLPSLFQKVEQGQFRRQSLILATSGGQILLLEVNGSIVDHCIENSPGFLLISTLKIVSKQVFHRSKVDTSVDSGCFALVRKDFERLLNLKNNYPSIDRLEYSVSTATYHDLNFKDDLASEI